MMALSLVTLLFGYAVVSGKVAAGSVIVAPALLLDVLH